MSQLRIPFSKEQFEKRCLSLEKLVVPGWTDRKTNVVRRFLRDLFKANWSSHDGTCTVTHTFLASHFCVSVRTVKNWVQWAFEVGLLGKVVSTDGSGRKRITLEINWGRIGETNRPVRETNRPIVETTHEELFRRAGLNFAKSLAKTFAQIPLERVELAVKTWEANRQRLMPEAIVCFLRHGVWPIGAEVKSLDQIAAIEQRKEQKRVDQVTSAQQLAREQSAMREWWDRIPSEDRERMALEAKREFPHLRRMANDSPLVISICWDSREPTPLAQPPTPGGVGPPWGGTLHGPCPSSDTFFSRIAQKNT